MAEDAGLEENEHQLDDDEQAPGLPLVGEERQLSLEFRGDARAYFRVWIVNLCLTLLTLGIFSPWAKVRKKRYLYSHTRLEGSPFQYLGKPLPILKGRVAAVVCVVIWYLITSLNGFLSWPVALVAAAVSPWVVVRSAAFSARYSAYRNMTFRFTGTYGGLLSTVFKDFVVTLFTCGFGYSWLQASFQRYMISRTHFGGVAGELDREGKDYVRFYVVSGAALFGWFTVVGFATGLLHPPSGRLVAKAAEQACMLLYSAYFVSFVYLKARLTNVVWNGTRLGGLRFESSLSFRRLLWIYASNTVAIVASLGLLTPWAVVRTAKYRAAQFKIWARGSLEEFEGSDASNVRAAGAELGEFFDLDVAL